MGGYTREGGQIFHVREEVANEGKNHRLYILTAGSFRECDEGENGKGRLITGLHR